MMVYTKNLILVCTGRDTTKAASLGMPVLQLCLGISQSGALQRLKVSAVQRHCLLGVTGYQLLQRRAHCCRSGFRGAAHGSARRIRGF